MNKNLLPEIIKTKGKVASFGGKNLLQNMEKADQAIAKMEYTERIWDRSRSQFVLKNLVHSFPSDWKNLRQISAEMQRKRDALREAKFNYAKKLQQAEIKKTEIEILEQKSLNEDDPFKKKKIQAEIKLLDIEIAEIEAQAEAGIPKIEGALKEILTLEDMHDDLSKRLGEIGEDAFEKHEARSHIKNAFIQAIREVRVHGRINTGVQEYLEQCGVNITKAVEDIKKFLEAENDVDDNSTKLLYEFLEMLANKYEECASQQTKLLGFKENALSEITYNKERDDR